MGFVTPPFIFPTTRHHQQPNAVSFDPTLEEAVLSRIAWLNAMKVLDSPHAARLDDVLAWRASPLKTYGGWTRPSVSIHPAGVGAGARLPALPAALRPLLGSLA